MSDPVLSEVGRPIGHVYSPFNPQSLGALGNDEADDTTAIQTAFDNAVSAGVAEIVLPPGIYRHTDLQLSPASGQINVNIRGLGGAGGSGVQLKYIGTNGAALTINDNTRYQFSNVRMVNAGSGTNTGLALRSQSAGSNHGPATFINAAFGGFDVGLHIGTTGDFAASELVFISPELAANGVGVLIEGINSLGLAFLGFNASGNTTCAMRWTGVAARNAQTINIVRASMSGNANDFDLQTPCHFTADGVYVEGSVSGAKFLTTSASTNEQPPTYVSVRNFEDFRSSAAKNVLALAGTYEFENCAFRIGADVGDASGNSRYQLIYRGGRYIEPTYAAGSDSVVYVSVGPSGTSPDNNESVADHEEFVFLSGGTKRVLRSYPWSGHPTSTIPTAVPRYDKGLQVGSAALATNATTGFLYVPHCAGTPTGTPEALTGSIPVVVDSTNHKVYFYSGGAWRDAGP